MLLAASARAQSVSDLPRFVEPVRLDKGSEKTKYAIELMVLHATNTGGGIDKRVGEMPELKKPPFSAYDTYRLLAKTRLPLAKNAPQTYRLPNSRILKTELKETPEKDTFKISASINQPGGKAFLPLLQVRAGLGQSFIVAGQTYKAGILVLVLRIVKS
jgi:hypothetical protein